MKCKKPVDFDINVMGLQCPYCKGKVFVKDRPTVAKHVKAK